MILQLDLGNTRYKWRIIELADSRELEVVHGAADLSALKVGLPQSLVGLLGLQGVQIASVASDEDTGLIEELLLKYYPKLHVFRAQSQAAIGDVSFSYAHPAHQGVDRCLAMVAAYELIKTSTEHAGVAVMDAGSALTVDFVDASGLQVSGYICGGLEMMRKALLGSTSRIAKGYEAGVDPVDGGLTTERCVDRGVQRAFEAVMDSFVREALDKRYLVVLTGGDASRMLGLQQQDGVVYYRDLVFDGLAIAANRGGA